MADVTVESLTILRADKTILIIFLMLPTRNRIVLGTFLERLQAPAEKLSSRKKYFFAAKRFFFFKYSGRKDLRSRLFTSGLTELTTEETMETKQSYITSKDVQAEKI